MMHAICGITLYPDRSLARSWPHSDIRSKSHPQVVETNRNLKNQQPARNPAAKQPWDPRSQALAPLPEVVKLLRENQWLKILHLTKPLMNPSSGGEHNVLGVIPDTGTSGRLNPKQETLHS